MFTYMQLPLLIYYKCPFAFSKQWRRSSDIYSLIERVTENCLYQFYLKGTDSLTNSEITLVQKSEMTCVIVICIVMIIQLNKTDI